MKLKQLPEDFQVEERTTVTPAAGPHSLYRLEKRGWSTPDALEAVRRRWKIEQRRISCGGMKDRHAHTVQYFTIFHGPERNLTHQEIHVRYLGRLGTAYTSADIIANAFRITLRDLEESDITRILSTIAEIRQDGVPNYFDDQRFGSVSGEPGGLAPRSGEFIAKLLVLGRFEDALRLALTGAYEHDRSEPKREKTMLRELWGDWATLAKRLPSGHARDLAAYLAHHPADFRGAMVRLRPELHGLYLSAYQSHLWNRMLARWLEQHCRADQMVSIPLRLGQVPFHRCLDPGQREALVALHLPLPSARLKLPADDPLLSLVESVLSEEGLQLRQMQVKGVRELFFSKGDRAALCQPAELHCETEADELHPGRHKAILSFELPRGAYATLLVKRISPSH